MKRILLSILIGLLATATLLGLSLLLERANVAIGLAYILWWIIWSPVLPLMSLLGGDFDHPNRTAEILALIFDVLLYSALAYLYLYRRGRTRDREKL